METIWNKIKLFVDDKVKSYTGWKMDVNLKKKDYILELDGVKTRFYLPYIKTDWIQQHIYTGKNYFEYDNLNYICQKWHEGEIGKLINNNIVLDVGANIGNHTMYYINECNAKLVYCFEPVKDTFRILQKNIEINKLSNRVKLVNVGVGNNSGKAKIANYNVNNIGGTSIEVTKDGDIDVVAIDDMQIEGKIGMVKMDVEGFEVFALKGMMKTLDEHKPFITIEIRNKHINEVCSMLTNIGYRYEKLDQEGDYADFLFYV